MPTLSFEGETHDEIVGQVRRWLASTETDVGGAPVITPEVVEQASALAKKALGAIADAYGNGAHGDVVKALTRLGTELTDSTRQAMVAGLDLLDNVPETEASQRTDGTGRRVVDDLNTVMAKQVLKVLRG